MKKLDLSRSAAVLVLTFALLSLLIASSILYYPLRAQSSRARVFDMDRRTRHARLAAELSSTRKDEFRQALLALAALDEPGALDVWEAALSNTDPLLQKEAWSKYQEVRNALARKELVPKVARIAAPSSLVLQIASSARMEVNVWSETADETVVAASPYLLEYIRSQGIDSLELYDSIADWQRARARGDAYARAITPDYQSDRASSESQIRIAVIDIARTSAPAPGYSDWLGDRENILMRNDSFIAYLDIFSSDGAESSIDSRIEERFLRRGYHLAGFYTPEEFADLVGRFFPGRSFNASGAGGRKPSTGAKLALAEGKFHSYEETLAEFKSLAEKHTDLAQVINLGQSYEGRQIFALKLTKNPSLDDPSKVDVLITGGHHAREWISIEPPIYFANQLVREYETDDKIKYLLDHLQVWIVPIVNPDGLVYSQGAANNEISGMRLWRKNRRPISQGGCVPGTGIDLNRNYDYKWRLESDQPCPIYFDDLGGSDNPNDEFYRGPRAESESEIKALKTLMDDPNRRFRARLDYHNYSQLILYPWGYQQEDSSDTGVLAALAGRLSDEIFSTHGELYRPQKAFDLYVTSGTSLDYAYAVNRIPAPFVIEMRPVCCNFNVPESEIAPINEENWAGARMLLDWAAGPPILESVKAYQKAPDGNFSKLVYSARWSASGDRPGETRQMAVETRFPVIEPGPLKVQLQFSKPMDVAAPLRVMLGREQLDEVSVEASDETEGWGKTLYAGDMWVGKTEIPEGGDPPRAWQLSVSAADEAGLQLDARPETVANYTAGTGGWQNYEDREGAGQKGGPDIRHILSPSLREGFAFVFVATPETGERLAGGDTYSVAWTVSKSDNFIPVQHEILLSTDGGESFARIAEGIRGDVDKFQVRLPPVATGRARIRVLAREGVFGNTVFGDNQGDFRIGANVNSAVEIVFGSSERLDVGWTDSSSGGATPASSGPARLAINLKVINRTSTPIAYPFLQIASLSRNNVLLSRDVKTRPGQGALQSLDAGEDGLLSPGETAEARLEVGLVIMKKFKLWVNLCGVPTGGTISPGASVQVWKGKPKNK
ncbi:MAG: M14 family metallopeptidase [Blastocatellia bacterium]|nr:M14 family metallopeptidase [Blastocatellia bacterium]